MSVTVLGRATSINVRKVLWTGVELGLTLAREDVDVTAASFRALNPNAMMPVLIDARGESTSAPFTMWESNPICRYLAAREARSDLLPDDPQARAIVEMWMDWQASELNNSWRYAFMALVRGSAAHRDQGLIDAGVAAWNRHMAIIDDQLQRSGGPFLLGRAFTLADVGVGLSTHRWRSTPLAHAALAHVEAYYERLCERPGFVTHGRDAGP